MITLSEVTERATKAKNHKKVYRPDKAKGIMKRYFKMIADAILEENTFLFPAKFGEIMITRSKRTPDEIRRTASKKRCKLSTINYRYSVELSSPHLDKYQYELELSQTMKRKLYKAVTKDRKYFTGK